MSESAGILGRYAVVLETLAASPDGMTLTELIAATGLPRGTLHRLIGSLREVGYVAPRDGRKVYGLGPRLMRLLHLGAPPASVSALARPMLQELAERFGETAYLAKLTGIHVKSAAMVLPDTGGQTFVQPGRVMPVHASSSGKAIFAFQDAALLDRVLAEPRERYTAGTVIDDVAVRADLAKVRRQGFAICVNELDPGVASYACPVQLEGVGVVYAVGLVGFEERVGRFDSAEIVAALRDVAERLTSRLQKGPPTAVLVELAP
ncbi:MAG: IclR family transcriptional regulator [Alphaproteobacteria bacterium]|nr:IclR family transcriptional regulator [Alphaproteobacteria bacterium]